MYRSSSSWEKAGTGGGWFKVLMLDPLDSSEAGHNLTNVNKVLFVSPLLVGNANATTGFYKQAIGPSYKSMGLSGRWQCCCIKGLL